MSKEAALQLRIAELEADNAILRESEARLREMVENSRDLVYRRNLITGRYDYASPSVQAVLGCSTDQLLAMSMEEIIDRIHPDDREAWHAHNDDLANSPDARPSGTVEFRWLTVPYQYRWVSSNHTLIRDSEGRPVAHIGTVRDVTERIEAESRLRESEHQFRLMGESIPYGVWLFDAEGRAVYASQSFLGLLEMTIEEMQGFGWTRRVNPDEVDAMMERWMRCVRTGANWEMEYHILGPDGRYHTVLSRGRPVRDDEGDVTSWVGIHLDITDRVASEDALRESEHRLRELSEALEKTVALRTAQLRALAAELTLVEQQERRRLAQVLHDEIQQLLVASRMQLTSAPRLFGDEGALRRLVDAVDSLLGESVRISRSLSAQLSPPILYGEGLGAALEWLGRYMEERYGLNVRVESRVDPGLEAEPIRVFLYHATREFLFNVVKHAQVSRASVEASAGNGEIHVWVVDEGKGFDVAFAESRQATAAGGFGLFSIRERATLLGGRMRIDSAPGAGTRILIAVPQAIPQTRLSAARAASPAKAVPTGAPAPVPGAERVIRLMVVDDHAIVRRSLAVMLAGQPDIEIVAEVTSGDEAITMAAQMQPDVVLMDVSIPGTDGIEATRVITSRMPHLHVIGLSMHGDPWVATRMKDAGACAYLTKGGDPYELVHTIRSCMSGDAPSTTSSTPDGSPG